MATSLECRHSRSVSTSETASPTAPDEYPPPLGPVIALLPLSILSVGYTNTAGGCPPSCRLVSDSVCHPHRPARSSDARPDRLRSGLPAASPPWGRSPPTLPSWRPEYPRNVASAVSVSLRSAVRFGRVHHGNLERSRRCPRPAASTCWAVFDQRGLSAPLACLHAGSVPTSPSSNHGDLGQQTHGSGEPKAHPHRSPAIPGSLDDESSRPYRSSATAKPDTTDRPTGFRLDDVAIIGPAEATRKALGMRWNPPHARRSGSGLPRLLHASAHGRCRPRQSRFEPRQVAAFCHDLPALSGLLTIGLGAAPGRFGVTTNARFPANSDCRDESVVADAEAVSTARTHGDSTNPRRARSRAPA
jgi:hypothetical protein